MDNAAAAPTFDRAAFDAALRTRGLGRSLIARSEVPSTNDLAWDTLAAGAPEGTVVVADAQSRGRGRGGRSWSTPAGLGLALSVAVVPGCDPGAIGTLPLIAGLALARGLDTLGARADLKWPNDLLLGGRKTAGILCESRRGPGASALGDATVIGVGVNVLHSREQFPPELRERATSLAIEGVATSREAVAAAFLNQLEPLLQALEDGGPEPLLEAWRARAAFFGASVRVRTPAGELEGIARALDARGALLVEDAGGRVHTVLAGDVEPLPASGERA